MTRVTLASMIIEIDIDLLQLAREGRAKIQHPSPEEVDSIRRFGITQPITARPLTTGHPPRYEVLEGETTWQAAQLAGIHKIPVYVVTGLSEEDSSAVRRMARQPVLAENPIEKARAIKALLANEPGLSRTELAARLGMTRSNLSHHLRILALPSKVIEWVEEGSIQYGQARVILSLEYAADQVALGREILKRRKVSVRALEHAARAMLLEGLSANEAVAEALRSKKNAKTKNKPREQGRAVYEGTVVPLASTEEKPEDSINKSTGVSHAPKDPNIIKLENHLTETLGSPVEINHGDDGSGVLQIRYHNLEILDGIIERLA